jgi:hypothetical protein
MLCLLGCLFSSFLLMDEKVKVPECFTNYNILYWNVGFYELD